MHEFRHQPLRSLILAYELVVTPLIRVPAWLVLSLPRSWRPTPEWSLTRCLMLKFMIHMGRVTSRVGDLSTYPDHKALVSGLDKDGKAIKALWVEPVAHTSIVEPVKTWMRIASVEPSRVPGYWFDKHGVDISIGEPPAPGEKVIYALHGGGYIQRSGSPTDLTANIVRALLKHCGGHVRRGFSLEYRLSKTTPYPQSNPFPAALLDALAGYLYLIDVGFTPQDIILEGDSAGGNLALALTRYLVENHKSHPNMIPAPPGSLILLSPWSDIGSSHEGPNSSVYTNQKTDYLGRFTFVEPSPLDYYPNRVLSYPKMAYVGPHGLGSAEVNPYISPASRHPSAVAHFYGFPRTFILGGGGEMLLDSIRTLMEKMTAEIGEQRVSYYEADGAVHDFIAPMLEPESTMALQAIAEWVGA